MAYGVIFGGIKGVRSSRGRYSFEVMNTILFCFYTHH
jgi:hypothetical protein